MLSDPPLKDFFVSYTRTDQVWAEWVAWTLEEAGYSTVLQAWDFRPGSNFVLEMQRAASEATRTIVILSRKYLASSFTQPEWSAAFAQDPQGKQQKLVPVRVELCQSKGLLASIVYLDLVGLPEKDARAALLGAFRIRNKPVSAPTFPGTREPIPLATYPGVTDGTSSSVADILPRVLEGANYGRPVSAAKRFELIRRLNELVPRQLNMLLFALHPPTGLIPAMPAAQGDRTSALLLWAEGPGGCGLSVLQEVLEVLFDFEFPTGSPQSSWSDSPYPGLRAFLETEERIFFGRDAEAEELLRLLCLQERSFVAVIGASGSGKSSLVTAGVIPRMPKDCAFVRFTPANLGTDPFLSLAAELQSLLQYRNLSGRAIADQLSKKGNLEEFAKDILGREVVSKRFLLLFIDQFEELFTSVSGDLMQSFINVILKISDYPCIRTIITLRTEFYQHCIDGGMDRLLRNGTYPLATPDVQALLEMIEKPAALVGLRFQERLVKRILEETGSGPGALALMAFAMRELYKNRDPDGVMSFKAYDRFGGVSRAIGVRAEEEFEKLDSEAQAALPHVFRELIQVNESGTATRQRAPFDRMTRFPAAARLIHAFVNARLLVTSDGKGPSSSIEVAHEAILLNWPRLNQWMLDTYDFHHLRRQIKQAASYWKDHGSRPETRWPDIRITEVSQMLDRLKLNAQDLAEVERDYLGPFDRDEMLAKVYDPSTSHQEREIIGRRLSIMGDIRAGVGLEENGLPDIEWCRVPDGLVTFSSNNRVSHSESFTFHVCPFLISRYPITYLQYRTFLEAPDGFSEKLWLNGLSIQQLRYSGQANVYDNYPADCICWFEAVAFSRWFSHRLGYYVRLPTEFEWQQAATGGISSNVYPWGSEWKPNCANTVDNGLNREMAVGLYPHGASPVGVLDMSGTVWEWCLNEYERPYNTEVAGDFARAIRGGSWFLYREDATTSARDYHRPNPRGRNLGFRLVQPMNDTRIGGAAS